MYSFDLFSVYVHMNARRQIHIMCRCSHSCARTGSTAFCVAVASARTCLMFIVWIEEFVVASSQAR